MDRPRAVFTILNLKEGAGLDIIVIRDQYNSYPDKSRLLTVTNDIETVVAYSAQTLGIKSEDFVWIYQNTEGAWDGWDPVTKSFYTTGNSKYRHLAEIINSPIILSKLKELHNDKM